MASTRTWISNDALDDLGVDELQALIEVDRFDDGVPWDDPEIAEVVMDDQALTGDEFQHLYPSAFHAMAADLCERYMDGDYDDALTADREAAAHDQHLSGLSDRY